MADNTCAPIYKLVLIGNSGVGKSCLTSQFCDKKFDEKSIATIGVDLELKSVLVASEEGEDKWIKLQIWDTAGQERFRSVMASYYHNCLGVMLVYDVTNKESFEKIRDWLNECNANGAQDAAKMLVGNKRDAEDITREVSTEEGEALAKEKDVGLFVETSAKDNAEVDEAFLKLAGAMVKIGEPARRSQAFIVGRQDSNEKKCCC